MATKKTSKKKMSDERKAALAKGREQGRAVREYLAALDEKRQGRQVDPDKLAEKIAHARDLIEGEPDPAKRVEHIQKRLDLEAQQAEASGRVDLEALKQEFISAAKEFSERKGITYNAWREAGVPSPPSRQPASPAPAARAPPEAHGLKYFAAHRGDRSRVPARGAAGAPCVINTVTSGLLLVDAIRRIRSTDPIGPINVGPDTTADRVGPSKLEWPPLARTWRCGAWPLGVAES